MPIGKKNKKIAGAGRHHIAIHLHNLDESINFYTGVMGMQLLGEFESASGRKLALLDIGDGSLFEFFQVND